MKNPRIGLDNNKLIIHIHVSIIHYFCYFKGNFPASSYRIDGLIQHYPCMTTSFRQ
uniref:Uncharacterized protein n=1 Tax=Arundo donax TaxID=35708 RepID=A0A0A9BN12_ARUDO